MRQNKIIVNNLQTHALNITALYIDANNNEIKRCHCCTQVNSIKKIVFFLSTKFN